LSNYTPQEKSALLVATITSFTGPFVISSVNVALPAIQKEFNADAIQLSWVATSLLLAVAVTLVPAGRIADIHGRKKIFSWGLFVYTLSSLVAAFANSIEMLIFCRVFQGIGSAMFLTTGMAIITSIFPPQKRGKAIGIYVSAVYIGLSTGPFVGGILTQNIGWRSLFIVVVPLGALSILITLKYLKGEWADARGEPLDIAGSFLYGIAILAWVYGASLLPSKTALYLMAAGALCMAIFVWQELRVRYPVVEVRLFTRNKLFTFSSLAAMIHYAATFAITFLLSLYLQYIKGLSPQAAGMIIVAQPVMMATFSPLAGKWSDKIEPRKLATACMDRKGYQLGLYHIEPANIGIWVCHVFFTQHERYHEFGGKTLSGNCLRHRGHHAVDRPDEQYGHRHGIVCRGHRSRGNRTRKLSSVYQMRKPVFFHFCRDVHRRDLFFTFQG